MKVEIAGIKTPINTVQADLGFDPTKLEVMEITTQDSFANIFIQKEINNETGYARLTGGLPSPGYFSDRGLFGTVMFKSKSPGVVKVEFLPTSMVLANDKKGTNVLKELVSVSYLILPDRISDEENKMQEQIYRQRSVLGASSGQNQLILYTEGQVLGQVEESKNEAPNKTTLTNKLMKLLIGYNERVLSGWKQMMRLDKRL